MPGAAPMPFAWSIGRQLAARPREDPVLAPPPSSVSALFLNLASNVPIEPVSELEPGSSSTRNYPSAANRLCYDLLLFCDWDFAVWTDETDFVAAGFLRVKVRTAPHEAFTLSPDNSAKPSCAFGGRHPAT